MLSSQNGTPPGASKVLGSLTSRKHSAALLSSNRLSRDFPLQGTLQTKYDFLFWSVAIWVCLCCSHNTYLLSTWPF